ncbi:hypothetical protein TorRG33x02_262330 [Trema orientale]|uniref:Uncharacterized protein n=1 Tax=Trema orientale TaxID=63057 RepID=A0A2P5D4Z4_TREOI|nr:hypothetical protein TorRG33x02_262330 [Trema orientale]
MIPQAIRLLQIFTGGPGLKPTLARETPRYLGLYPFLRGYMRMPTMRFWMIMRTNSRQTISPAQSLEDHQQKLEGLSRHVEIVDEGALRRGMLDCTVRRVDDFLSAILHCEVAISSSPISLGVPHRLGDHPGATFSECALDPGGTLRAPDPGRTLRALEESRALRPLRV